MVLAAPRRSPEDGAMADAPQRTEARPRPSAPGVALMLAGLASAAIYLALTRRMSLQEYFPGPGVTIDFKDMLGEGPARTSAILYGAFAALLALWGGAIFAAGRMRASGRTAVLVFAVPVLLVAVLASMYPPMASDFFHNLADGRLLWRDGANPMVTPPGASFPIGISFGDEPSAYGPLWYVLLAPPSLLGFDHYLTSLVLLKLWMGAFYLAAAVLTWLIARRLTPGREAAAVVLLAWNPFVVWRALGNGHNDVVMMAFTLAAVWAVAERRWAWAPVALAASVLVKYTTLLAAPALVVYVLRLPAGERRAAAFGLARGTLAALALSAAIFAPFWEGPDTFDQLREQGDRVITSTPLLLEQQLGDRLDLAAARAHDIARWSGTALFAAVAAALLWRQRAGVLALIAAAALTLLAFNLIAAGWFRPWYFLWVAMLTPLLPGRWWLALTIAVAVGGLLPDVIEQYRNNIDALDGHLFALLALPVGAAFLPPLVVWVAALLATGRADLGAAEVIPSGSRSEPR